MDMELYQYLHDLSDPRKRIAASELTQLSGLDRAAVAALGKAWPTIPAQRRLRLLQSMSDLADDNVDLDFSAVYKQALSDGDASVRVAAIQGLWEYDGRDLIEPLVALLRDDPEPSVRAAAALSLGRYAVLAEHDCLRPGDVSRLDAALREAAGDGAESIEVRARAIEAAGARSQPWARDLIDDAYGSGNERLRIAALHAMGRSCDDWWLPTLIDNLSDEDAEVRYEAATACGALAGEEATPYLVELIADEDGEVRLAAIEALGAIGAVAGDEEAVRAVQSHANDADASVREAVRGALEEISAGDLRVLGTIHDDGAAR